MSHDGRKRDHGQDHEYDHANDSDPAGGEEHLTFDVINGRMTVLDTAKALSEDRIIKLVGSTGMSASLWDADSAAADQAAHLKRQKFYTALSAERD